MNFKSTWWGKIILVFLSYVVFWFIFYGAIFLIPEDSFYLKKNPILELVIPYIFIFVPVISFFMAKFLKISLNIKYMYILNIFLLPVLILVTFWIELGRSVHHLFSF